MNGILKVYSVYPHVEKKLPLYLKIHFEITSPIRVSCSQNVRWRKDFQAPPLICAGYDAESGKRYGVTLINVPLTYKY